MSIKYRDPENAGDLADSYNRLITGLPYCYPVSPEEFIWGIQKERYTAKPFENLHSDKLIINEEAGRINGFIHIAIEKKKEQDQIQKNGIIRFISYQPGNRLIGQTLLNEAENHFRDQGIHLIKVFAYIYRFYYPDHGQCEKHGHISGLLGINGYTPSNSPPRQINMAWENFQISEPVRPDEAIMVDVEKIEGYGQLPNLMIHARRNGQSIGECESYSLGHLQRSNDAQDQILIRWLGINNNEQTKGWGLYLLQRTLWEAQQVGYKHSLIATGENNHRALLCYTNYGYQVLHSSQAYVKHLENKKSKKTKD